MEGGHSSVGDHWKGLGIGRTLKYVWNWKVVRVQGMPKVSEVRVGKTPRHLGAERRSSPDRKLNIP